jgi:branched-chain amino acid transport system substrate-binding protein
MQPPRSKKSSRAPRVRLRLAALLTVSSLTAAGVLAGVSLSPATASPSEINVGFSLPLSAATGGLAVAALKGAQIVFDQANAAGGVDGHKINLVGQDNSCTSVDGVTSAEKLLSLNPKPVALLGAYCSVSTEAIEPIVKRDHVPLLVDTAGDDDITSNAGVGGNKWVFRWGASNDISVQALFNYVKANTKIHTIALITDDTAFGLDGAGDVVAAAKAAGIKVLSNDALNLADTNFDSVLARVKAEKPDAVFDWVVWLPGAVNFYREYGQDGLASTPLIGIPEIAADTDSIFTQYQLHGFYDGLFTSGLSTPQAKSFEKTWLANGQQASEELTGYDGYQGAEVLLAALKAAKTLTPNGVRLALKSLDYGPSILGGTIQFDSHDQAHDNLTVVSYKGTQTTFVGTTKS